MASEKTSELIGRVVTPFFDEVGLEYDVISESSVYLSFPSKAAGDVDIVITDLGLQGVEALAADVFDFVDSFPTERALRGLLLVNEINARGAVGKFSFENRNVSYRMDWPVNDSGPEQVKTLLGFTMYAINTHYSEIAAARWGNDSIELARRKLARLEGNENEEDDGGGSSEPGILSDEDIRRMMDAC